MGFSSICSCTIRFLVYYGVIHMGLFILWNFRTPIHGSPIFCIVRTTVVFCSVRIGILRLKDRKSSVKLFSPGHYPDPGCLI